MFAATASISAPSQSYIGRLKLFSAAVAFFVLGAISACRYHDTSLKWTEEVRLSEGRVVILTRYQEFKGPHELTQTPSVSDYWFEFKHPDSGKLVRWQSDRDLATLVLLVEKGGTYLLTRPHFGSSMKRYGCPSPPYLLFRLQADDSWAQVPITDIPIKNVRVNMTFNPDSARARIKASGYRLLSSDTSNSEFNDRPFIINFSLMKEQTFALSNCSRTDDRDYLVDLTN